MTTKRALDLRADKQLCIDLENEETFGFFWDWYTCRYCYHPLRLYLWALQFFCCSRVIDTSLWNMVSLEPINVSDRQACASLSNRSPMIIWLKWKGRGSRVTKVAQYLLPNFVNWIQCRRWMNQSRRLLQWRVFIAVWIDSDKIKSEQYESSKHSSDWKNRSDAAVDRAGLWINFE